MEILCSQYVVVSRNKRHWSCQSISITRSVFKRKEISAAAVGAAVVGVGVVVAAAVLLENNALVL